jgi:hypothetical protein
MVMGCGSWVDERNLDDAPSTADLAPFESGPLGFIFAERRPLPLPARKREATARQIARHRNRPARGNKLQEGIKRMFHRFFDSATATRGGGPVLIRS